jgi:hypothetical protein
MLTARFSSALRSLVAGGIDFILVGGLAAILNGAPVHTLDVDVVFRREPKNLDRILQWMGEADAIFRIQPERRFRPNESHLAAGRHLNLLTKYGPMDFLGTAGEGLGYEELLPNSALVEIDESLQILVLNLETIISIKEKLASEKDLAVLPILRSTLKALKDRNP